MADILQCVSTLGPLHCQTVLLGYPPFLKGVVEAGKRRSLAVGAEGVASGFRCL